MTESREGGGRGVCAPIRTPFFASSREGGRGRGARAVHLVGTCVCVLLGKANKLVSHLDLFWKLNSKRYLADLPTAYILWKSVLFLTFASDF